MPRFFFNIEDGVSVIDTEGQVLADAGAAYLEALRMSPGLLNHFLKRSTSSSDDWRLEVFDENRHLVATVRFTGRMHYPPPALVV